jgi:hypothetical protein
MDTPGTDRLEELSRPRLERPPRDASADATASAGSGR